MSVEYRIEYTIQRMQDGEEDFADIGFGSSGGWLDLDAALHAVATDVQLRNYETEPGMPDPKELKP